MKIEDKAKAYDKMVQRVKELHETGNFLTKKQMEIICPELAESEDEKVRKELVQFLTDVKNISESGRSTWAVREGDAEMCKSFLAYLEKQKESLRDFIDDFPYSNEQKEQEHICDSTQYKEGFKTGLEIGLRNQKEMYEAGKGTTVCGQDYKCKKDYKVGNCWYIKDAIYHCGRDGYLTDQNGVSWSCTPEWFNEYIQSNTEWAEEEKTRFVSGQFLQCKLSFDEFKEGEHYWLEYVGDDMYVGRSDNILNQKFHITPRQLYTLFSQQLEEKQKEQKPADWSEEDENVYESIQTILLAEARFVEERKWFDSIKARIKSVCWDEKDEKMRDRLIDRLQFITLNTRTDTTSPNITFFDEIDWLKSLRPDSYKNCNSRWKPSEEQMEALESAVKLYKDTHFKIHHKKIVSLYEQLKKLI